MSFKFSYYYLKISCPIALRIFYKRFKVCGRKNVPLHGPVIFAPNHQNAFMDAVIVASVTPRSPWFLTRASVFSSSIARFWLNSLKMTPIYRFRDGMGQVRKNNDVIGRCTDILSKEGTLLIFPEGNHNMKWRLRPLQKGITRISFAAEEAHNFKLGIKIVPVGLQYENHVAARSDVMVSFGKAIEVSDYIEQYQKDPGIASNKILSDLKAAMSELIIDIKDAEQYESLREVLKQRPGREKKLKDRFKGDKRTLKEWIASRKEIRKERRLSRQRKRSNTRAALAEKYLLFPFFLYGWINHLFPWIITKFIQKKAVWDPHFIASVVFASGLFLFPIFYFLQIWVFSEYVSNIWFILLYGLSLPLTGLIAYDYYSRWLKKSKG